MFGRKKKVNLDEVLKELAEDNSERSRRHLRVEDGDEPSGVRFKVEFEGVEDLIKEIKELRGSIDELIDLLKEQGSSSTAVKK
ncbi:MAG: hypothetical protein TU36_006685 [Vulcanisaeta sp. AZ3]|jgi:hypothetical protein|nr:MAG: hypothetical protein TU36_01835 [Vulcanisaeta sp. AZ3]